MADNKIVVFDVGGVFFDFKPCFQKVSDDSGLGFETVKDIWIKLDDQICQGKISTDVFINEINQKAPKKLKIDDFTSYWTEAFVPDHQIINLALSLSKTTNIGMLTNIFPGIFDKSVESGKIPYITNCRLLESHKYGLTKPNPQIFLKYSEIFGFKPNEILLIDDTLINITEANNQGWNTHHLDKNINDYTTRLTNRINSFIQKNLP